MYFFFSCQGEDFSIFYKLFVPTIVSKIKYSATLYGAAVFKSVLYVWPSPLL